MAISDTITSMYENVGNVYDVLELAGADLTNVDKNIENLKQSWEERLLYFLANGTDTLWNNWEKVSGSGTEISLNNTIEAKMDFVYKGNTYQYSTTGKNLLQNTATRQATNGVTFTINSDKSITCNGTATANAEFRIVRTPDFPDNEDMILTGCPVGGSSSTYQLQYSNNRDKAFQDMGNGIVIQKMDYNTYPNTYVQIRIVKGYTCNNLTFYPMIRLATIEDDTYEPYTGNQPSPSPDYPQEIQVVSGDNTIKVEGKNLFDKNTMVLNGYINTTGWALTSAANLRTAYIPCKPNTTYTITKILSARFAVASYSSLNFGTIGENGYIGNNETRVVTTTSANAKYLCVFYYHTNDTLSEETIRNSIMIQEGNITTPVYEPYQSQTYPINLGNIELCKIGNYQDKIYKDNGKWYLNKQIGKVVYTGSESGSWTPSTSRELTRFAGPNISNAIQTASRYEIKSNYFHYLSSGGEVGAGFIYSGQFFAYPNQTITTEQNFRNWLSAHNTTVYYVIATPTNEEITDTTLLSQLETIKKSYNTQTNISQENDNLPFELDVVALGELEI